ncbi:MAG: crossover junction endodeoxyribonuclease RuvC [Peptoniphilaceae bacterium]|nr:crossover junction endodeoxyribonuclease RuvC [Peptoniphilaceae bacterium]MDY6085997.1 crossover junction endodeoxyribonuclease RuvC [Peptoniphilaceae bacterium]
MRILGIDPGLARMGYGVIDFDGNTIRPVAYGVVETAPQMTMPERLLHLFTQTQQLIDHTAPDEVAFEELFFYQNKTTGITVAEARGVEVLTFERAGLPLYEYTPSQIKQAMTGYGRATKVQMQKAVTMLLRLEQVPQPDDAADGLAVAMTHAFGQRFKEQQRMR